MVPNYRLHVVLNVATGETPTGGLGLQMALCLHILLINVSTGLS